MIINITNTKQLQDAKALVKLLNTKVIDKLEIGKFIFDENVITKLTEQNEEFLPSDLLKEVNEMAELISKDQEANKKVYDEKNWDLALPLEESDLAQKFTEIFTEKFSVWYADVLNTIFLNKAK